jgi:predicted DNA-binding protein (MmcQ/YjbR family)
MDLLEEIREYCLSKPGVTEDMKWGNHLCFSVGLKMFFIVGLDEHPTTASIKVGSDEWDFWLEQIGVKPAPYLARDQWIFFSNMEQLTFKTWKERIDIAYDLKFLKLTKKLQKEISGR